MVEYTETDLAREMEELKTQQAAGGGQGAGDGGEGGESVGRRRAPPRRKVGSNTLAAFEGSTGDDGQ